MHVTYVGPLPAVEFRLPDGTPMVVERGGDVAVPEALGRSLLEQPDNWQPVQDKAPAKKKDGE